MMLPKCILSVFAPVKPLRTLNEPTMLPLITTFQSTSLPALRTFDTTSTFRIADLMEPGPATDWVTLSPRAADQKYPHSVSLMKPTLPTTVEELDGKAAVTATE